MMMQSSAEWPMLSEEFLTKLVIGMLRHEIATVSYNDENASFTVLLNSPHAENRSRDQAISAIPVTMRPGQISLSGSAESLVLSPEFGAFVAAGKGIGDLVMEGEVVGFVDIGAARLPIVATKGGIVAKCLIQDRDPIGFHQQVFLIEV